MLRAKLTVPYRERQRLATSIVRELPKLFKTRMESNRRVIEDQVQRHFYHLLTIHPFVNDLLFNRRVAGEFGVPSRDTLEGILWEFVSQTKVSIGGIRTPVIRITIPSKDYMLSLPSAYAFDPNGNVYPWLSNIFNENFTEVRDFVYREAFGEKTLSRWSRSGEGIMVSRPGSNWQAPDGYTRDFVSDVISSNEFTTFLSQQLRNSLK